MSGKKTKPEGKKKEADDGETKESARKTDPPHYREGRKEKRP